MMSFDDYQDLASRTAWEITNRERYLCEKAIGLPEEAGELAGLAKKEVFQGRVPPKSKIIEEAGDVLWYLAGMCRAYGVSLQQVAEANIAKLEARYPDGFVKGGGNREAS